MVPQLTRQLAVCQPVSRFLLKNKLESEEVMELFLGEAKIQIPGVTIQWDNNNDGQIIIPCL